jgi:hypothetical protein
MRGPIISKSTSWTEVMFQWVPSCSELHQCFELTIYEYLNSAITVVHLKREQTTVKKLQVQIHQAKATCYILSHGNSLRWRSSKEKKVSIAQHHVLLKSRVSKIHTNQSIKENTLFFLCLPWWSGWPKFKQTRWGRRESNICKQKNKLVI